ncbi:MAG: TonB-dependent receptor [Vicinamibacteria bacterium]|nr:TonB-dependent receptor [Vicinamibacteria bacterium]
MRHFSIRAGLAFALGCFLGLNPSPAHAQATGSISGTAKDDSGAVLPGVTIEATLTSTNATRTATTGADGFYTIQLVQPGSYTVKAGLSGFSTFSRSGVKVSVSETALVNVSMKVGGQSETVEVSGEAPLIETGNATLGIVIDEKKVVDLPLNGRNFTQLGTLIPGVVAPPSNLGGQNGDATPGGFGNVTGGFNVNGQRNQSNNFLLDGATNNDTFNTGFVLRPPPDAIQEFKILTHSYSAEYGRNSGSVVNVVTKSGSNEWHGAAWEFNRSDKFQERNFFVPADQPKPELKQNQFGASLGGPIMKDKLFAFGYYEGYRNTRGTTSNLLVPTAAQRSGELGGTVRDPLTGAPFPGGVIPANRISPISAKLLSDFMPLPNSGTNRYVVSPNVEDTRNQAGGRLDYRLSNKHQMLGRFLWSHTQAATPRTVQPADQLAIAKLMDIMVSDTYAFSPNAINQARFSVNKIDAQPAVTSGLTNSAYGINVKNTNPLAVGLPSVGISGFPGLGDPQQPFVQRNNDVYQITDDFSWLRGRHSMKFGLDLRQEHMFIAFINRPNGDFTFSGAISGSAFGDFLLGYPAQFRATTQQGIQDGKGRTYSGYAQDEFRYSNRLTLNIGLRYELATPFVEKENRIVVINPDRQSTVYPAAPKGLLYPGDSGIPDGGYKTDKNNFAPRLAFAWDPTGHGRTSVRGAWGIFYDSLAGQGDLFQAGVLAPPFTPLVELNATASNPFLTFANPLGTGTQAPNLFPANLTIIGWGPTFNTPSAQHYNLTVQQQIRDNIGLEVGYVGSRGKNLPIFMEVNPLINGVRKFPAFALLRPTFTAAESWYNSLQASLRMRPTKGINFLASYTLGNAKDHVSGLNIGGEARPVLPITIGDDASLQASLDQEKGPALFDVRHRFVFSFGAELPKLSDKSPAIRAVLGGWQLNGIFQGQTGFPFTVTDPVLALSGLTNRPNVTCDPNEGGARTVAQWFNTSCFTRRPAATTAGLSSQSRNSVLGPGFNRTDLSVFKNFTFSGNKRFQIRVEAFNLFNQERFNNPVNNSSAANFGQLTSADDGRIIQFGAKFTF